MDPVYVEDVAWANVLAARSEVTDEVFNIASGVETSLDALAMALLDAMGSDLRPEYHPTGPTALVSRRFADVSKARQLLGFEARVSLEDGLRQLVTWWREARLAKEGGPTV
jgi:UDP-glucose 4-epimerase